MSNSIQEAKRKRKNRNRIVILLVIYFMIITLATGIIGKSGGLTSINWIVPVVILSVFTIIYWVAFYIVIRRENQKYKKGK